MVTEHREYAPDEKEEDKIRFSSIPGFFHVNSFKTGKPAKRFFVLGFNTGFPKLKGGQKMNWNEVEKVYEENDVVMVTRTYAAIPVAKGGKGISVKYTRIIKGNNSITKEMFHKLLVETSKKSMQ